MCACGKKSASAWISVTFVGETVSAYRGRNTKRNYGNLVEGQTVQILRSDFDPNVMRA